MSCMTPLGEIIDNRQTYKSSKESVVLSWAMSTGANGSSTGHPRHWTKTAGKQKSFLDYCSYYNSMGAYTVQFSQLACCPRFIL